MKKRNLLANFVSLEQCYPMNKLYQSKALGLLVFLFVYLLATGLGVLAYWAFKDIVPHILLRILIADVFATIFVWLVGVILKTASIYDPYWSVQTFIIYLILLIVNGNWNLGTVLLLVALLFYTVRLTLNFIIGFDNLQYIDWRYRMLKEKSGKAYQLVNLFGICMMPTLIVYLASVPAFFFALDGEFQWIQLIGLFVMVGATFLELIADVQMKRFIKTRTDRSQVINVGFWKYSRHPNYLGEISFWFGLAFVFIFTYLPYWYWIAGAFANLLLFLFISIPMEEKHMKEYKPSFLEYKKKTSMLLILPQRKQKNSTEKE